MDVRPGDLLSLTNLRGDWIGLVIKVQQDEVKTTAVTSRARVPWLGRRRENRAACVKIQVAFVLATPPDDISASPLTFWLRVDTLVTSVWSDVRVVASRFERVT